MSSNQNNSNILSLVMPPSSEQIWEYVQADPQRLAKALEIVQQAFLPEFVGSDSRRFMKTSVKSSSYFFNLANQIGEDSQLAVKNPEIEQAA